MPALPNARQEKFCTELVSGKSVDAAYEAAGYSPNRGNAARMNANEGVRQRVAELKGEVAGKAKRTAEELAEFCENVIFTPLADLDENSHLVQEVTYEVVGGNRGKLKRGSAAEGNEQASDVRTLVKFKVPNKLDALEKLAKLRGLYAPEKLQVEGNPLTQAIARIRRRKK